MQAVTKTLVATKSNVEQGFVKGLPETGMRGHCVESSACWFCVEVHYGESSADCC